jgi:hypothetical protein
MPEIPTPPAGMYDPARPRDPPPMRVTLKGWLGYRDLPFDAAEAWHLREAAKLAGDLEPEAVERQAEHLRQARLNRVAFRRLLHP